MASSRKTKNEEKESYSRQRWARRVFGGTGTGTGSVPVPVPVPEFPFQGPLLPFQGPFFVRSSFRSGCPLFFFGTDSEQTRSSFRYYRSSYRSCPFQLPFLVSSKTPFRALGHLMERQLRRACSTSVITVPGPVPGPFLAPFLVSSWPRSGSVPFPVTVLYGFVFGCGTQGNSRAHSSPQWTLLSRVTLAG